MRVGFHVALAKNGINAQQNRQQKPNHGPNFKGFHLNGTHYTDDMLKHMGETQFTGLALEKPDHKALKGLKETIQKFMKSNDDHKIESAFEMQDVQKAWEKKLN